MAQEPLELVVTLGDRLDPAHPRPELECLVQLAGAGRRLTVTDLRRRAGELGLAHPGRASALLASAFAPDFDGHHERWLVAVALAGDARSGQAAVQALALAGREEALADVADLLLTRGDAPARAALALDALPTLAQPERLARWIEHAQGRPRVGDAVWGLAMRSQPEAYAPLARAQVGGVDWTRDVESLRVLARGSHPWLARAAWRALVACASVEVVTGLQGTGPGGRGAVLAALVTWRSWPGEAPPVELWRLHTRLGHDEEARVRLEQSLEDRWRRWRLMGADGARVRGQLEELVEDLPPDSAAARVVRSWLVELEG